MITFAKIEAMAKIIELVWAKIKKIYLASRGK